MVQAACCQLNIELANHQTDIDSSSFSKYAETYIAPSRPQKCQAFTEVLQQVATYVALVNGEKNPLTVDLLKQCYWKNKISEGTCMFHYPTQNG